MRSITPAIIAVLLFGSGARAQRIIYVDDDAAGFGTGVSWKDGYTDLQDALDDARDVGGCPCEVWIAAGVYKPDRGTGDRTMSFELVDSVSIYGGFVGWEMKRDQRDPAVNETILDGDLNGDDDLNFNTTSDCCEITGLAGCDDKLCEELVATVWDSCPGFWDRTCANIAQRVCCEVCRPTRCENVSSVIRAEDVSEDTVLDGVIVSGGEANGGGVYPEAPGTSGKGGGISMRSSSPLVSHCTFAENYAGSGMGIHAISGHPTVTDCLFIRNGGVLKEGATLALSGDLTFTRHERCRFVDNQASGMEVLSPTTVVDCEFRNNDGYGLRLFNATNVIRGRFVENRGGGLRIENGTTAVYDSVFFGNSHGWWGGGIFTRGSTLLVNCLIVGNHAGGGISYPGAEPVDGAGGGIANLGLSGLTVINTSVVNNTAGSGAGALVFEPAVLTNSIFSGNRSSLLESTEAMQVRVSNPTTTDINYSLVEGWTGEFGGVGNSGLDPMFVDKDGLDDIPGTKDDNLRLLPGSPAINTGDPVGFVGPAADLDGHPRTMCGRRDIGAYEFGIGDYDCDQVVDLLDFAAWNSCVTGPDPNRDGEPYTDDCKPFDFDTDKAIDLLDFAGFQGVFDIP